MGGRGRERWEIERHRGRETCGERRRERERERERGRGGSGEEEEPRDRGKDERGGRGVRDREIGREKEGER